MKLRIIFMVLALLAVLSAGIGGYGYYDALRELRLLEAEQRTVARALTVKNHIDAFITEDLKAVKALAGLLPLPGEAELPEEAVRGEINRLLDIFCEALAADVCYLMNRQGTTIAASNRNTGDSFIGNNYAFRPYFREAISGNASVYMARGVTTNRRGIYYSQPVYAGNSGTPAGVAVVKAGLRSMEQAITAGLGGTWVLVSPGGIIFATNHRPWQDHLLWEITREQQADLIRERQFGAGPWAWSGLRLTGENQAEDRAGNRYRFHRTALENESRWEVYYLIDEKSLFGGISDPLIRRGGYFILLLCFLIGLAVIFLYRKASDDIERRKNAETALQENERRYRIVFENTGTGTVLSEQDMTLSMVNNEFARMTGFSRDEIEGKMKWTAFIAPGDQARMQSYHFRRREGDVDTPKEFECRMISRDGTIREMLVKVELIPDTRTSVGSFLDVTAHKEALKALQVSEDRYRRFFESDFSGAYISRPDGDLVACNPAFAEIFGFPSVETALQADMADIYVDMADRECFLTKLRQERKIESYETEMHRLDTTEIIQVVENAVGIFDKDDQLIEIWGYLLDITEKKNMEKKLNQATRLEAVGTLAGGVAHDFNNLLMAIQGHISLMLHETGPEHPLSVRLHTMEQYVQNGSRLTGQLLGFARKGYYAPECINLNNLISDLSDTIGRTRKEVAVACDLSPDLHAVQADRGQIEQILFNLAVNALDAMTDGGTLSIGTQNVTEAAINATIYAPVPGKYVMMEMTDTGEGMDREILDRIFEPFFTTKPMGRGTGLGLASTFGIVKNHEGYITVDSTPGVGSTFRIYLPAAGEQTTVPVCTNEQFVTGKGTILLVDDEEMVREVGSQMLEVFGYSVIPAESGEEALDLYAARYNDIHMVILDMIMPGKGGGEVFEAIRAINPDARILLSSGYSVEGQAQRILEQGCDGFIQKPFNMKEISAKIREILDQ